MKVSKIILLILSVMLVTGCAFNSRFLSDKLAASMDVAIADHNMSEKNKDYYSVWDYDVLGVSKSGNNTTVYAMILYEEYSYDGTNLTVESGAHIPTAITFDTSSDIELSIYDVVEYWEPRDGSFYADDIKDKFPLTIQNKAFDISGVDAQHERCRQAAKEHFESDGGETNQDELIWDEWDSLKEAEAAVGFDFELPEIVANSYKADEYKTLNGEIIEVTYRDDDYTVYVRKQKMTSSLWADLPEGYNETDFEVQDSFDLGDGTITYSYNPEDENSPFKTDILYKGFCWALFAPKGYWGDSAYDFSTGIYEPHIQIDPERVERIQVTTQIIESNKDVVVDGEQLEELIYKLNSYKVNATDKEMGEGWQYMFTIEHDGNEKRVITFMDDMVAFYEDTNLVEAAVYIVEEYSPNDFLYLFE